MKKLFSFSFLIIHFTFYTICNAQAPVANFSASNTAICDSVYSENFTDLSTNNPTSWKWYFPGATPDTSTLKNPTNIAYKGYGCYTVKLVVKNNIGSDSLTKSNYICLDAPPHIKLSGLLYDSSKTHFRVCGGVPSTLMASGGTQYRWSTGETTSAINIELVMGNYYDIRVYNGACFEDSVFFVSVDTVPHFIFKGDTSICAGDITTVYALTRKPYSNYGYQYLWNTGSTTDSIIVDGKIPGYYTYYVSITHGACSVDSSQITVGVHDCTGTENFDDPLREVNIYPNPSNGIFQLEIKNHELGINNTVEVYNVLGENIYQSKINSDNIEINLSAQPQGMYLYRVITETGNLVGEGKLIIQK